MKKTLVIALMLAPALTWAQSGMYTVKGKMGTLNTPAKAYLRYMKGDKPQIDTAKITNGAFEFKGSLEAPQNAMIAIDARGLGMRRLNNNHIIPLYLEPGTIMVQSPDSALNASVKGTPLNVANEKLKVALKSSNEQMAQMMKEYQAATPEQRKSKEFDEAMDARYEKIQGEQKTIYAKFIKENPKSVVSLDALRSYGGSVPEYGEVEPMYASLDESVKSTPAGKKYSETLAKLKTTAIGAMAPGFTQADTTGRLISLTDFKGKYVLLDFWASWCGPCRQENPNVVANYQKYKDKNFTVLGVSLDQPGAKEAWMKAIHKDNLTWTHVSDLQFWNNEAARLYGVQAIPQNFLLDPNGKIIAKNIRGKALGEKLAEILATN
ncbi:TlpA disulfide reductase family protein [Siphonobacter curvatus]|uniref:Alkyl hydroperoxide reductase n=1 Tax=Siphonobacter curvatus TaxID=2094562 RepID=A0A2S7IKM4_9BACT|nr:TlpA disulfide reductase family protein [Siphonobacter curvatus]PQA58301.1 alkyl hydroperoxide reductase [Siphonobacter curvatus]